MSYTPPVDPLSSELVAGYTPPMDPLTAVLDTTDGPVAEMTFPNTPSLGNTRTAGGKIWTFDGTKWKPPSGGGAGSFDGGTIALRAGTPPTSSPDDDTVQVYAKKTAGGYLVPVMTSATTPSGVVSASSSYVYLPAWWAFTRSAQVGWTSDNLGVPAWIQYAFPTAKKAFYYSLHAYDNDTVAGRKISEWKVQGSNDGGITWTDLDHQVAYDPALWAGSANRFAIATPADYVIYRLLILAINAPVDNYVAIKEFNPLDEKGELFCMTSDGVERKVSLL